MNFPKYETYKESGVDWLGEVPAHWIVSKAKWLWHEIDDRSEDGSEELLSISRYTGVSPTTRSSRSESLEGYRRCKPNDLAMNIMLAWQGGLGISKYDGIVSPAYCIFRLVSDNNPDYLGYLYRTPLYLDEFGRNSTGIVPSRWRLYPDKFGHIQTILPPKPEQDRIVEFLDQKTAEIDALIAKKERQIQLLNEQKAIRINQAVTRGLNPDVRLKPSGVEWIGDIPKHWEVVQLKRCVKEQEYGLSEPATDEGEYTYLGMGQIRDMSVYPGRANRLNRCPDTLLLKENDLLFNRTNSLELVGKTGIFKGKHFGGNSGKITYASYLVRLRPQKYVDAEWLNILMGDQKFLVQIRSLALPSLHQANLTFTRSSQVRVPLPPLKEQVNIVSNIATYLEMHEATIKNIQAQIQSLKTLRSTLIAHAVTGKIKV